MSEETMDSSKEETICLSPDQAVWLKMVAPHNVHERYRGLCVQQGLVPHARAADSAYSNFLYNGSPMPRTRAELIFHAHGVTPELVRAVGKLGLISGHAARQPDRPDQFFEDSVEILWRGGQTSAPKALLSLLDSILFHKGRLTDEQQHLVLGPLLEYLKEARDFNRWSRWMIATAFGSNTDALWHLRAGDRGNTRWRFPKSLVMNDPAGADDIDLRKLSKAQLDACGFFVRRFNLRINEIRHQNYQKVRAFFDTPRTGTPGFSALREKRNPLLRACFKWVRLKILPFWEDMIEVDNPDRWYFLVCGARLLYDWMTWRSFSVKDADLRAASNAFRKLLDLSERADTELATDEPAAKQTEHAKESSDAADARARHMEELEIRCRLKYLASGGCRHMAESASRNVWTDEQGRPARYFAQQAAEQARQAHVLWELGGKGSCAYRALSYIFARNHARQLTFVARWWLLHPTSERHRPRMHTTIPEYFGTDTMTEASGIYQDLFRRQKNKLRTGCLVLNGKLMYEYEFHLRVWIEQLAFFCQSTFKNGNDARDREMAMTCFSKAFLIYLHLFVEAQVVGLDQFLTLEPARKEHALDLKRKVVQWLKNYRNEDCPFDEAVLRGKVLEMSSALTESRFETICALKYGTGSKTLRTSTLWKALADIERRVRCGRTGDKAATEFATEIWPEARLYLETDLKSTIEWVKGKEKQFLKEHRLDSREPSDDALRKLKRCWRDYPPWGIRHCLVFEAGNNPAHVDLLLRRHDLDWERVRSCYLAEQDTEDKQ